eukprot:g18359.t1
MAVAAVGDVLLPYRANGKSVVIFLVFGAGSSCSKDPPATGDSNASSSGLSKMAGLARQHLQLKRDLWPGGGLAAEPGALDCR